MIEIIGNDKFWVKLFIVVDLKDVEVIDIKYYKKSWGNVLIVFCR